MDWALLIYIIFGTTILLLAISLYYILARKTSLVYDNSTLKSNYTTKTLITQPSKPKNSRYKGLVLFDIDGTLTTGKDNHNVVQYCINQGWAVGICTAGAVYDMNNLLQYEWMPKNLWNFIRQNNDITFNNVASGILVGKQNFTAYDSLNTSSLANLMLLAGYRKGFALIETGKALGITNPQKLVLCDDMTAFIQGALMYNSKLSMVCSGQNCGGNLTINTLINAINRS